MIRTSGDRIQDRPLAEVGGKGLFTKEIEEALAAGAIDLAVHSSKDMPTVLPAGLVLSAFLPREDARDVFISRKAKSIAELPHGATVGTASLRRQALVKRMRPDLTIVPLRGNVETRLRKLDEGVADATLLALAGLKRLGLADAATAVLDVDEFLPAVGQGAIGIETRADDARTRELLAAINHADTVQRAGRRARLPRRARRLVPHADRRPCHDLGRTAALSRHDREARRQRSVRDDARGRCARCREARRRCRRGIEGPRRPRLLQRVTMRLLVTRPEPDNERTAAVLRAQGHEVVLAPLLHIEAVADADLGAPPWAAILLTSANGARALADHPRRGELHGAAGASRWAAAAPTRRGPRASPM